MAESRYRFLAHGPQKPRTPTSYEERTYVVLMLSPVTGRWMPIGLVVKREGKWGHVDMLGREHMACTVSGSSRALEAEALERYLRRLASDLGWCEWV
jgi:hypothetical protein